ncbi:MAG: HAD-IA family hydrolase [Chloroflexota bacterium]|nr:HAD-IA family hydrolase [Chloroflexota bacterium]MDE3102160.1 HAD-IA family hydrolase [Chloroflexota bacterium]
MPRYDAIGFDLLTALLDTWSTWKAVAGDAELGMKWHAASQALLRGRAYRPYEDIVRDAAREVGVAPDRAEEMLRRYGSFAPWPDTREVLSKLESMRRFVVTNCSDALGTRAAATLGGFELVMTAEAAGAYKPDPRPYRAALDALGLPGDRVLFVAGSAHDVGGASRVGMHVYWANRGSATPPADARALIERRDLRGLPDLVRTAEGTLGTDPAST